MSNSFLYVQAALEANIPALITSPPGQGKTTVTQSFVRAKDAEHPKGAHMETVIASLRDPTDFAGLPMKKDGEVYMAPPSWARRADAMARDGQFVVIFFDELTTAPPATQAALLRVLHERVVGDLELHPDVRMLAAANPPEVAAGGWSLEPPTANRLAHFEWKLETNEWTQGMVAGFPPVPIQEFPKNWESKLGLKRTEIAAFINARPGLLNAIPKNEDDRSGPWPSSRTWHMASRLMAVADGVFNEGQETELLASCVGQGAAVEFLNFRRNLNLPDPHQVLAKAEKFDLSKYSEDQRYAVLAGVTSVTVENLDKYWVPFWKVMALAAEQKAPDLASAMVLTVRTASKDHKKVLPNIRQYVQPFIPMLQKAGMMPDGH